MDISKEIYGGGFYGLLRRHGKHRQPYTDVAEILPAEDVDFEALKAERVPTDCPIIKAPLTDILAEKVQKFEGEFAGQSKLLLLHATLIAVLRRRNPPQLAIDLFLRLWSEQGRYLADNLTIRWKISAATTFADHGSSATQRSLGMGLSVLFDSIKMHDTERGLSAQPSNLPFEIRDNEPRPSLALDLRPVSLRGNDIGHNMLARLWLLAEEDTVMFPLARSMLQGLMTDDRSIFARLQMIKASLKDS